MLAIALPWGEWLQINFPFSRMDWSRQIFEHAVWIYLLSILFRVFRSFWQQLFDGFINLVDRLASKKLMLWIPCLLFFLFSSWISLYVFDRTLLIQDSAAHMFQAKIFLQGKYFAPAPAVPDFFSVEGDMVVLNNGKWYGMYLPGFAAILAAAIMIHAQWIICSLMGALSIAIWVSYVKRWYDARTAFLLSVICLFSPFLLLMSSTIMIHTPELLIVSAAIYFLRNEAETPSWWNKAMLGLILAAGITLRGFSILATIAPMLAYSFYTARRNKFALAFVVAFSLLAGSLIVTFFQLQTTGNPFLPGYRLEYKVPLSYGFGETAAHQMHTPIRGLENISNLVLGLDYWLTGWHLGAFIFVIFFVLFCKWTTWDRLLLANCFTLLAFYYLFPLQDLVIGPRFLYPIALILLLFVARTILITISSDLPIPPFPFVLFLFCFLSFFPLRLPQFIQKYQPQKMQAGALKSALDKADPQPKIAFLERNITQQFVNWNDPWLREPVILMRDLGTQNEVAIKNFPDRKPVYFGLKIDLSPGGKKSKDNGYAFRAERAHKADGSISLMQVALAMNTSNEYRDQDFFDQGLSIFMEGSNSSEQMKYLDEELIKLQNKTDRMSFFREGLIHTSRMLVLLKQFHEQSFTDWAHFSFNDFRENSVQATDCFNQAADPGKELIRALDKMNKRIDRNDDASLSNDEIRRYLQAKIKILEVSDW
jgi:hypothetical protein